jgi:virginiamycin B lyase
MPSRPTIAIAEFSVSDRGAGPYGITAGPDGALRTALETGTIARLTVV